MAFAAADPSPMTEIAGRALAEFETAIARERGRLFGIAFAILRDPIEAEDVVQETVTSAWQSWASRTGSDRTAAWLTTICVRKASRHRSGLFRRLRLSDDLRGELRRADQLLQADGRDIDLHRAHGRLSKQQRAVISLHYRYGYTLADCARLMGCSAGAVSSHLSRALARLRKELSDD